MALRINHNIPALNALRNLNRTDEEMSASLERLSSGQKVNRAADGPATLVISEQMRGQISSINQAIQNSESSISMVQTAEAALDEVNKLLISLRQLSIHAANEGANDDKMLAADQAEVENALDTIDRIARTSQFGTRTLLDGSNGANGIAVGEGLEFVEASPLTKSSPAEGYEINITQAATRSEIKGKRMISLKDLEEPDLTDPIIGNLDPEDLPKAFQVMISEGGKSITFSMDNPEDGKAIRDMLGVLKNRPDLATKDETIRAIREIIVQRMQQKADASGLEVEISLHKEENWFGPAEDTGPVKVRHKKFGSQNTFSAASNVPGVLAQEANVFESANPGLDVQGTIDGVRATGEGDELAAPANSDGDGLKVRFRSERRVAVRMPKKTLTLWSELKAGVLPNSEIELENNPDLKEVLDNLAKNNVPIETARLVRKTDKGSDVELVFEFTEDVSGDREGFVHVTQNSLAFQVGPTRGQQVKVSLVDAKSDRLSTGILNESGFRSLRDIDVTKSQGAQDALLLIDESISQIASVRANLGAFQKNTLQSNAASLRIAEENLTSAESALRDADMAEEMSKFTRNQIMLASGMAMLAQANQTPQSVLQLLSNRQS